ncbi:hypothetical protein HDV05_007451 [Chytridiales sp. JEL 0842]|nr:hypothetical protein HDV05_007451 [Chytridiales sp. JEL 0842]
MELLAQHKALLSTPQPYLLSLGAIYTFLLLSLVSSVLTARLPKKFSRLIVLLLALLPCVPILTRVVGFALKGGNVGVFYGPLTRVGVKGKGRLSVQEEIQAIYDAGLVIVTAVIGFGLGGVLSLVRGAVGEVDEEEEQAAKAKKE